MMFLVVDFVVIGMDKCIYMFMFHFNSLNSVQTSLSVVQYFTMGTFSSY